MAGGVAANRIAKWNGNSWSALGLGMNDTVKALAVSGSDVYAGGIFTTAGGNAVGSIAKWNGSNWSGLGAGVSGRGRSTSVSALAVLGGHVYAGGFFSTAGGSAATNIARWNGSSWSALGSGIVSKVGGGLLGLVLLIVLVRGCSTTPPPPTCPSASATSSSGLTARASCITTIACPTCARRPSRCKAGPKPANAPRGWRSGARCAPMA